MTLLKVNHKTRTQVCCESILQVCKIRSFAKGISMLHPF